MARLKKEIKKTASKYGSILGAVLILLTVVAFLINWDLILRSEFQVAKFILVLAFSIYAVYYCRKTTRGRFTFREGFSAYFITIFIGLISFTIANWLLLAILFPDAGHYINNAAIALRKDQLVQMEWAPDKIEETIKSLKSSYQFSLLNQLKGLISNLVLYCIPGAIVALFLKTKKPIITR